MRLRKLTLQNIGAFVNRNEIGFDCDHPIILIGGMNGRGKTTILESVLLALYGRRAGDLIGNSQKFEDYLQKISNVNGVDSECSVELEFQGNLQQETVEYKVKRFWDRSLQNPKAHTKVWKNGREDEALSDSWDMFIEEILPHAVAPFFFFDGEKISDLASASNEEQISQSIKALLGVDVIERLIQDLGTVEARKAKELHENEYTVELEELEGQIQEVDRQRYSVQNRLKETVQSSEADRMELETLEERYAAVGGHYVYRKKGIESELRDVRDQLRQVEGQLLELSAGSLPLRMVAGLLGDIADGDQGEREQNEIEVILSGVPRLYEEYRKKEAEIQGMENFLGYIKDHQNKNPVLYGLDEETRFQLMGLERNLFAEDQSLKRLLREKRQLQQRAEELENYLLMKADDEIIQSLFEKIKEKTAQKAVQDEKIQQLNDELEELEIRSENLIKSRVKTLEKIVASLEAADEAKRTLKYVQLQEELLKKYKLKLQGLKARTLSEKMTECFKKIIAKEGLIETIRIHPDSLTFTYYNRYQQAVDKMALSAGEKQLLVIAMLWALGICAKAEFPVIIDTPLARLDSVHRASLINNYFPYAGQQVIILSTDQEITATDYEMLRPYVGREYTLRYHEETMSSTVEDGYFRRVEE